MSYQLKYLYDTEYDSIFPGLYQTITQGRGKDLPDELMVVFKNGEIHNEAQNTFAKIRDRASLTDDDLMKYNPESHKIQKKN